MKKVVPFLFVAIVAYTLGTFSSINAKEDKSGAQIKAIEQKLDKVLENQNKMIKALNFVRRKV